MLLGDTGVGKSSVVMRFVTNTFDKFSESTIGCVRSLHSTVGRMRRAGAFGIITFS